MSLYEIFLRAQRPSPLVAEQEAPPMAMTYISRPSGISRLLSLSAELRSQIYGYVLGRRVIHIRMNWVGIFSPTGFSYSCFDDLQPLLESSSCDLLAKAVPFDTDITSLNLVCRQMYQDSILLPFKLWIWAFEDAFTLDQFVTAKGLGSIPLHHKEAIRCVAVAPPGPQRSHERVLQGLQEVLLISMNRADISHSEAHTAIPHHDPLRLRRDTLTNTWLRKD